MMSALCHLSLQALGETLLLLLLLLLMLPLLLLLLQLLLLLHQDGLIAICSCRAVSLLLRASAFLYQNNVPYIMVSSQG